MQTDKSLYRNSSSSFQQYMVGVGGPCDVCKSPHRWASARVKFTNTTFFFFSYCSIFLLDDPPVSYWCSEYTSGGGAFPFRVPQGFWSGNQLPNAPYNDTSRMIANVWRPARWAK